MQKQTSAKVLRNFLVEFRSHAKEDTENLTVIWERYVGNAAYSPEWFEALDQFWRLIRDVREDIEESTIEEDVKKDFLSHVNSISAIGQSRALITQWKQIKENQLKEDSIVKLGYIHNSLRLEVEHAEIAKHDADEILTLAREIVASLDDTKIPDEVAKHIRASVARIIFALEHLNIFGVAGVEDAIAHLLGKSWLHRSEVQEIEKKSPGTLKKLGMMTGKLLTAIKWGVDRAAAIEDGGEIVKRLIDASEEFL